MYMYIWISFLLTGKSQEHMVKKTPNQVPNVEILLFLLLHNSSSSSFIISIILLFGFTIRKALFDLDLLYSAIGI